MSETVLIAVVSASAALLGALLTAIVTWVSAHYEERRRARAAEADALMTAAQTVLSKGLTIIDQSNVLSGFVRSESSPYFGLAVLLRLRHPVDRSELIKPVLEAQEEIRFAGAQVALLADQETVALCNRVLQAATELALAYLPQSVDTRTGRGVPMLTGLPKPDADRTRKAIAALVEARRAFADRLREVQGRAPIDVYAISS